MIKNKISKKILVKDKEVGESIASMGAEISVEVIKESCKKLGLGIDDYVQAIKDALSATKMTVDKFGEDHIEDDHDKRLKAALIGLELEGYIKNKQIATDNSKHTHVTYSWQPVQVINNPVSSSRIGDVS